MPPGYPVQRNKEQIFIFYIPTAVYCFELFKLMVKHEWVSGREPVEVSGSFARSFVSFTSHLLGG